LYDCFLNHSRHWLYGEKLEGQNKSENELVRAKGWFPRRCVVEVMNSIHSPNSESENEDLQEELNTQEESVNSKKTN